MGKRITDAVFKKRFAKTPWHKQFIQLTPYKGTKKNIEFYHKPCGHKIKVRADHALKRGSCKYCKAINNRMTFSGLLNKLKHVPNGKHYKPLKSTFKQANKYCIFRHTVCGRKMRIKPNMLLVHLKENHTDCKYCYEQRNGYNTKIFKKQVAKVTHHSGEYSVVGKYKNNRTKILMRHNTKHPHTFKIRPCNFLEGYRCPIAERKNEESHGERYMIDKLKSYGMKPGKDFIYGYHLNSYQTTGHKLHEDIWMPKLHRGIEFDGQQHFEPVDFTGHETKLDSTIDFLKQLDRDNAKDAYMHVHTPHDQIRIENDQGLRGKKLKRYVYGFMDKKVKPIVKQHRKLVVGTAMSIVHIDDQVKHHFAREAKLQNSKPKMSKATQMMHKMINNASQRRHNANVKRQRQRHTPMVHQTVGLSM